MELLYSLVTIHSGLLNGLIPPCGVAGNESNLVPRLFIRKKKKKKNGVGTRLGVRVEKTEKTWRRYR